MDARADTCAWILEHKDYKRWIEDKHGLLWILGKPGSGKSTLMKRIFQTFNKDKAYGCVQLAFFFHKRGTQLQQTQIGMFRTLLYQLLSQVPSAGADFQRLYEEKKRFYGVSGKDWEWRDTELRRVLQSTLITAARTHAISVFLDALDEAGEDSARLVISYLYDINEELLKSEHTTSICFSCRHHPIIRTNDGIQICVEDENKEDISRYLQAEFGRQIIRRDYELESNNLDLVQTRISSKASGVFLWVVLIIPGIVKQYNEGTALAEILEALEKAPSDIGMIYKHILDSLDCEKTLHLMQWICLAKRPLSLTELRYALASDDSSIRRFQESAHESKGFVESNERMKDMITGLSGGLAEVKPHDDDHIVQFIHQSVNDYLLREGFGLLDRSSAENAIGRGHDRLAKSCINYLKLGDVQRILNSTSSYYSTLLDRSMTTNHPFLKYATESCFLHAQQAESNHVPQFNLIQRFQWPSAQYFSHWIKIFRMIAEYDSRCPPIQATLLHLAAGSNLLSLVKVLLESNAPLEQEDGEGSRALHYAARWGHERIVRTLLDAGAVIDAENTAENTPLERAAANGHEAVIELLIKKGAAVNCQSRTSGSALQSAALGGKYVVVRLLLDKGADVKAQGGEYGNALQAAAYGGNKAIVELLLDRGADVNAQGGHYGNALAAAAYRGNKAIIELLLDTGAEVNAQDKQRRSAIHFAARGNSAVMIEFLVQCYAVFDVTYQDMQGCSILHYAASGGCDQVIKQALKSGADIGLPDSNGWTALHWACRNGKISTVQLLLTSGADIRTKDHRGLTPLAVAIFCGNESLKYSFTMSGIGVIDEDEHNFASGKVHAGIYCSACLHVC